MDLIGGLIVRLKNNYRNINNLHSLIKFFYYAMIVFTGISFFATIAIPFVPDSYISFEKGIREWVYSVDILDWYAHVGVNGNIANNILPSLPIDMINIKAAIIIDVVVSKILEFIIVVMGLRKMLDLTTDILDGESPFQLKHIKSLRKLSYAVLLYSTLGNTLLCILIRAFATSVFNVTVVFSWSGVVIGIMGYIFSDITEYGLFLQDEYDATL
jgi:hypothetical protein